MAANTLTGLIPDIYAALDTVVQETIGFIPAVTVNPPAVDGSNAASRAAIDQTVTFHQVPALTAGAISPAAYPADPTGITVAADTLSISKQYSVPFGFTGDEQLSLGASYGSVRSNLFAQAFRTLRNLIEADLAALYAKASRAYGSSGTTPFASDTSALNNVRKILIDNGTPDNDLHCIIDTVAGVNLRNRLGGLTNTVGNTTAQTGRLVDLSGFMIGESAQVKTHTKGTGSGYLVNLLAGYAVGSTSIAADTGTGTLIAGDVLSFEDDTNKYVTKTALSGGTLVIANPGLQATLADGKTITINNNYTANMAFHRSAMTLLTRLPVRTTEGDMASDVTTIADPVTGINYEIAVYPQYRQTRYEVAVAWGVKMVKPEFSAIMLG